MRLLTVFTMILASTLILSGCHSKRTHHIVDEQLEVEKSASKTSENPAIVEELAAEKSVKIESIERFLLVDNMDIYNSQFEVSTNTIKLEDDFSLISEKIEDRDSRSYFKCTMTLKKGEEVLDSATGDCLQEEIFLAFLDKIKNQHMIDYAIDMEKSDNVELENELIDEEIMENGLNHEAPVVSPIDSKKTLIEQGKI